jgi:hypothetical protein
MPRQPNKNASLSAPRSSSKRPAQNTPTRQSKRAKASAKKSYAEPESDDDEQEGKTGSSLSVDDNISDASDFEEVGDAEPTSDSEQEEAPSTDEDVQPKTSTPRGRGQKKSLPSHVRDGDKKELWKSGAKLAPGVQVIIKKPKARDAGDTPYTDETVHPNTMLFLKDLTANNDRQWLKCMLQILVMCAAVKSTTKHYCDIPIVSLSFLRVQRQSYFADYQSADLLVARVTLLAPEANGWGTIELTWLQCMIQTIEPHC